MSDVVWRILAELAGPLGAIVVAFVVGAVGWSRSRLRDVIETNVHNQALAALLTRINDAVWDAVLEAERGDVAVAKRKREAGGMSDDQYRASLAKTKASIVTKLAARHRHEMLDAGMVANHLEAHEDLSRRIENAVVRASALTAAKRPS